MGGTARKKPWGQVCFCTLPGLGAYKALLDRDHPCGLRGRNKFKAQDSWHGPDTRQLKAGTQLSGSPRQQGAVSAGKGPQCLSVSPPVELSPQHESLCPCRPGEHSSEQIDAVLQQLLLGLARQAEGAVVRVGGARVARRDAQLLEVGLVDRAAAGVDGRASVPGGAADGRVRAPGAANPREQAAGPCGTATRSPQGTWERGSWLTWPSSWTGRGSPSCTQGGQVPPFPA